jgi:HTH-type transcriptional regulator / antitoxin HigA
MEQENLKQKDLIPIKRKLTLEMIRNLHEKLKIPFDSLFTDYNLKSA